MNHVALDGAGPDNGDLNDEVIEGARLDARQHRHLRAAFDLEGSERVGLADHRVGARVLGRNGRKVAGDAFVLCEQVKAALHAAQHSQSQTIDLHESENIDVVFVPFDDLPLHHCRRLDRDQLVEAIARQHEAAGMPREMAWRANQIAGKVQRKAQPPVMSRSEVKLLLPT
jgi:hypothetical protein